MREKLTEAILARNKDDAVMKALSGLADGSFKVPELYQDILTPLLNSLEAIEETMDELIWREHILSAIVRSIIEAAYPYVINERKQTNQPINKKVLIFCPAREDHEIGARMAADFFVIMGYQVTYMGANTPQQTVLRALEQLKPDYLSISVSNRFNLFETKKLISILRRTVSQPVKIFVGGAAFNSDPAAVDQVGADQLLATFQDIVMLRKEEDPAK